MFTLCLSVKTFNRRKGLIVPNIRTDDKENLKTLYGSFCIVYVS